MGDFLVYTLVSGLALIAGYLTYKWLLASENQPRFNRVMLLLIYAVSLLIWPLSVVRWLPEPVAETMPVVIDVPQLSSIITEGIYQMMIWPLIIGCVYIAGAAAVALWSVFSLIKLIATIRKGERIQVNGTSVILMKDDRFAPFSWGRYIVMSRRDYEESGEMVLRHEQAHIRNGHFFDLLLGQAVCILLWYNPASWLMLAELKAVHEYEADTCVLKGGANAKEYQLLLIKKAVGGRFQSFANSPNHSKLKKRITMMQESKTNTWRRLRALAILPATAAVMAVTNVPGVAAGIDIIEKADYSPAVFNDKVTEKSADNAIGGEEIQASEVVTEAADAVSGATEVVSESQEAEPAKAEATEEKEEHVTLASEKQAEFPGGQAALMQWLAMHIKYPEEVKALPVNKKVRVIVSFIIGKDGKISGARILRSGGEALDNESLRVVSEMPAWEPAEVGGEPVASKFILPIFFVNTDGEAAE